MATEREGSSSVAPVPPMHPKTLRVATAVAAAAALALLGASFRAKDHWRVANASSKDGTFSPVAASFLDLYDARLGLFDLCMTRQGTSGAGPKDLYCGPTAGLDCPGDAGIDARFCGTFVAARVSAWIALVGASAGAALALLDAALATPARWRPVLAASATMAALAGSIAAASALAVAALDFGSWNGSAALEPMGGVWAGGALVSGLAGGGALLGARRAAQRPETSAPV